MHIRDTTLVDRPLGASHTVSLPSAKVMRALAEGVRYDQLLAIAQRSQLSNADVVQLLGFLNIAGALCVRRSPISQVHTIFGRLKAAAIGIHYGTIIVRHQPSLRGIITASLHAGGLVLLSSLLVGLLTSIGGLYSPKDVAVGLIIGNALFLASLIAHEYGHLTVLKKHVIPAIITSTQLRLGIVHPSATPQLEATIALRGPLYGCCMAGAATCMFLASSMPSLALLGSAIFCMHLGSLLPWYGDGKSIQKSAKGISTL